MKHVFTSYQKFVIATLAFLQFTVMLDFMVISPLGVMVLEKLRITTSQFGLVVSAYAFSAGASGILAAGFADRFDRKRLLLFFYMGFLMGTVLCGIAPTYHFLLGARIVTGVFGGVISSISLAIIADLFPLEVRGRVMGFVMTAFAASQVLGIPFSVFLATHFGWRMPFLLIAGLAGLAGIVIAVRLRPIDQHLGARTDRNVLHHLFATVTRPRYLVGFASTMLLATGGFMLMPFGSAFNVHNMGIALETLPVIYMVTGVVSIVAGPLLGRLSDYVGKYRLFFVGSAIAIIVVLHYTALGVTPLWWVLVISAAMFVAINARMISAQAMITAVPAAHDRGAFMAINSALQQLSGGVASLVAGMIVVQTPSGTILHYRELGFVVSGAIAITMVLMYVVHRMVHDTGEGFEGTEVQRGPGLAPASTPQPQATD